MLLPLGERLLERSGAHRAAALARFAHAVRVDGAHAEVEAAVGGQIVDDVAARAALRHGQLPREHLRLAELDDVTQRVAGVVRFGGETLGRHRRRDETRRGDGEHVAAVRTQLVCRRASRRRTRSALLRACARRLREVRAQRRQRRDLRREARVGRQVRPRGRRRRRRQRLHVQRHVQRRERRGGGRRRAERLRRRPLEMYGRARLRHHSRLSGTPGPVHRYETRSGRHGARLATPAHSNARVPSRMLRLRIVQLITNGRNF